MAKIEGRSPNGELVFKSNRRRNQLTGLCRSPHGERGLKLGCGRSRRKCWKSLPTRGAWIEIAKPDGAVQSAICRSPHGERGLKSAPAAGFGRLCRSLPTRGAWIEIITSKLAKQDKQSRSPHGERGLKSVGNILALRAAVSLPTRGAWIEMSPACPTTAIAETSLPTRGAWIEIEEKSADVAQVRRRSPHGERGLKSVCHVSTLTHFSSLPTRGAWIEMQWQMR